MSDEALPNLFVVGVPRGGTTSLWYYLDQHPDIFMSEVKEPYFFSDYYKSRPRFPKDRSAYLELFAPGRDAHWRGEASTAYFWDPPCAGRIREFNPAARIVISLRDPADRAYSEYRHNIITGQERRPFLAALRELLRAGDSVDPRADFLTSGFYMEGLERYLDLFGDRVHVLFLEELRADPRTELERIFTFLGVDLSPSRSIDLASQNASSFVQRLTARGLLSALRRRLLLRRSGNSMPPEARALLDEIYEPEREPLARLLRRPLPWRASAAAARPATTPTRSSGPGGPTSAGS
jgi:Sulfotransferase domain